MGTGRGREGGGAGWLARGLSIAVTCALGLSLLGPASPAAAADDPDAPDAPAATTSTTTTLDVQPAAANNPPVAVGDTASMYAPAELRLDPRTNDSDPDGDALTITAATLTPPQGGTVTVDGGTELVIKSTAGFTGHLTVTYTLADGKGGQAEGTVDVTVLGPAPNKAPVTKPDAATVRVGKSVTVAVLDNDTDPDGDALTLSAVAKPSAGKVAISGAKIVYTAGSKAGKVVVTYTVKDTKGATAQGTLTVTVEAPPPNHAPVAKDDTATVQAGSTVKVAVLANDSDPDGDALKLSKVAKPSKGTAAIKGSKVSYKAGSKAGTVRITYTVKDARGATDKGILTVTVTAKPKPPTPSKRAVEAALADLGFPVGKVNGTYDAAARRAFCAWRTVTGRKATRKLPSSSEARAIAAMDGLPRASGVMVTGVTVSVTCQAAFWVSGERKYKRIMAATTGKPGYRTRLGTFRIFRAFRVWRYSTIYPEARMYKPMQFSGGQALHGSSTDRLVKTYPASHGCVRMLHRDVDALQAGGVWIGTRVRVIGHW